jgi:hypothetical protein
VFTFYFLGTKAKFLDLKVLIEYGKQQLQNLLAYAMYLVQLDFCMLTFCDVKDCFLLLSSCSSRMEEGSDYYVVKKGDMVGVYKTLNDCQAQICSSVCDFLYEDLTVKLIALFQCANV